ncbi:uncharacterized protein LOC141660892 [Apium graveolens]|uniref:uncharacterized protein LOC141660892 n=1 Tax=Apium graveolens TaxID=4045 RepID=UPI003D7A2E8D
MVVDKANQVLNQASPTMQATKRKEPEQGNFYLKKNSEARIYQMVSNKEQAKIEAAVETEEVQVDESSPNKKVKVGSGLEESFKERLASLLREYKDVFSWSPRDMPGLHESIAMYSLDVNPNRKPVKQKRRNFALERQKAIDEEVEKLIKAGIINEIKYPEWLANVVTIKMNPKDIPKTVFITHIAVYAYVMLPFGLTSAGSTNERAMNKIFKSQIGRNLECYVDDIIFKSTTIPGHVEDLKEFFDNLRKNQLKLNPEKCTFGVGAGAQAVGAALIREENGRQPLVYYVSQVLKDTETRYPRLEKFAFSLITTSRKLRHYFQGREIRVVTNQPLRKIIHKPDMSGRLVNWDVELSQFNLSFIPRTAIKAQALADFIIECNFPEKEPEPMNMDPETEQDASWGAWTLKVDGSSTSERSGAGLILKSPEGFTIQTAISFGFPATNNQAEYEALIAGLKLFRTLRVQDLKIYSDS